MTTFPIMQHSVPPPPNSPRSTEATTPRLVATNFSPSPSKKDQTQALLETIPPYLRIYFTPGNTPIHSPPGLSPEVSAADVYPIPPITQNMTAATEEWIKTLNSRINALHSPNAFCGNSLNESANISEAFATDPLNIITPEALQNLVNQTLNPTQRAGVMACLSVIFPSEENPEEHGTILCTPIYTSVKPEKIQTKNKNIVISTHENPLITEYQKAVVERRLRGSKLLPNALFSQAINEGADLPTLPSENKELLQTSTSSEARALIAVSEAGGIYHAEEGCISRIRAFFHEHPRNYKNLGLTLAVNTPPCIGCQGSIMQLLKEISNFTDEWLICKIISCKEPKVAIARYAEDNSHPTRYGSTEMLKRSNHHRGLIPNPTSAEELDRTNETVHDSPKPTATYAEVIQIHTPTKTVFVNYQKDIEGTKRLQNLPPKDAIPSESPSVDYAEQAPAAQAPSETPSSPKTTSQGCCCNLQ